MKRAPEIKEGDIVVIERDEVIINLSHNKHPERIIVEFCDEEVFIPCDHHHHKDEVGWSCYQRFGGFFLVIAWKVERVRKIKWHVEW